MKRMFMLMLMCLTVISLSYGITYLTPGTATSCILDSYSNTTYCAAYPSYNVNQELNYNETWVNNDINVNLTCKSFPYINQNISLNYDERKTYGDYNLSISCVEGQQMETVDIAINSTYKSDLKKIEVRCAPGREDVGTLTKELYPGEGYYNIKCMTVPVPTTGTIYLYENTTYDSNWSFISDYGQCEISIKPDSLYMSNLQFATKYESCESQSNILHSQLSDLKNEKNILIVFLVIIGIIVLFFIIKFILDTGIMNTYLKPGFDIKKPSRDEVIIGHKNKMKNIQKATQNQDYYNDKYFKGD